ncbi:putative ATP-dependent protease [uncultured Desulfobacterium sp.]|uniref:endopeptidase La n=1 Tax=uncultured Desulfobacterium sp. TaxID=201089 RepID=A0A445N1F3_9BACT|nr:putative ATP-dependent protease [uncultured Desulfobacterium sp.]
MPRKFQEVSTLELRAYIDPDSLPFDNTSLLEPPEERILGQERATDAIKFGIGMKSPGYHIFVAGPPKAGLTYTARTYLEEQAQKEPTPPDWCYVHNFKEADKPKFLKISAGRAKTLNKDMSDLISEIQKKIPEVFDGDEYSFRKSEMQKEFERFREQSIEELSRLAEKEGFILQISQMGMVLLPATEDGQPMSQERLSGLDEGKKNELREKSTKIQKKMEEAVKKIRKAEAELKNNSDKLNNEIALFHVGQIMEAYIERYKDEPDVIEFLKAAGEDVIENIDDFKKQETGQQPQMQHFPVPDRQALFRKYTVNVLIDNSATKGAPVVIESNPTYPNLFGTIERQAWFGALFTDFTMIKPGVLHKANGGYLIMKALDLLKWYLSWEALKRALREQEIRIEDPGELYGLFSTRTIRPEPIPLDIKIVLTGDPYLYELLHYYDDRFPKLFKIKAHMDDQMDRKEDAVIQCAKMIGKLCQDLTTRHLDKTGVARVIEYSMERTEDREKLTLEIGDIGDLIKEADYYARIDHAEFILRDHVEQAINKRIFRSNLVEERVRELVEKDILWVETDGEKIGQINGLSIIITGDHEFGKPNRITATVSVGREGVVAIERESKMSGNIHTKGVMILISFLKERFAHNKPLSLNASFCFEQSYGLVEGDSASSAELFVLLSALARVPFFQGIAVTGSVSQKGEIQPVGGVSRKVEGFFDICKYKGLTGRQGVIVPHKNLRNLMLKKEVTDAVERGQFHIWAISTIEEGLEILTGMDAGKMQEDGSYPEDTVFGKVDERLFEIAEIVKKFDKELDEEEGGMESVDDDEDEEEGE